MVRNVREENVDMARVTITSDHDSSSTSIFSAIVLVEVCGWESWKLWWKLWIFDIYMDGFVNRSKQCREKESANGNTLLRTFQVLL